MTYTAIVKLHDGQHRIIDFNSDDIDDLRRHCDEEYRWISITITKEKH